MKELLLLEHINPNCNCSQCKQQTNKICFFIMRQSERQVRADNRADHRFGLTLLLLLLTKVVANMLDAGGSLGEFNASQPQVIR